jgi:N-acetylglucosamine-6-phosphate deacetylase
MPDDGGATILTGAAIVLPDRVRTDRNIVIEGGRIVDLVSGPQPVTRGDRRVDLTGRTVVPGFVDVHVHGVAGIDVMDGESAVGDVAAALPQYGVTAFCPTGMACPPADLDRFLTAVATAGHETGPGRARVLPAHLESNFINPEYCGAQPAECLRSARDLTASPSVPDASGRFSAREIVEVIDRHHGHVGIVTLAPELDGALSLVRALTAASVRVSLGHSAASFDEARAAVEAGAGQATHLFNRMRPMTHRDPGLVGAALSSDAIVAEIIADGHHVHPAMVRMAVAAKGTGRVMAVTDGTAGSGLPAGSEVSLGGRPIVVGQVATLEDGTMAGSVTTMDRVFAHLVTECGLDLVEAATVCATTPARQMGLPGVGAIVPGAAADLVVLGSGLRPVQTWVAGVPVAPYRPRAA